MRDRTKREPRTLKQRGDEPFTNGRETLESFRRCEFALGTHLLRRFEATFEIHDIELIERIEYAARLNLEVTIGLRLFHQL